MYCVTPPIPVRPDWRIRTGFGVRNHILGLLIFIRFFFSELNLYLWYTNNFCNNQQSFTFTNELPPEWYILKFTHIYLVPFTYTNTHTYTYLIQHQRSRNSAGEHLSLRWPVQLVWNVLSSLSPLQYLHGLNTRAKLYA